MKNIDTIFWDWNGTLLNDLQECLSIINVSLKKRSLPFLNEKEYLEKFEFPVRKYYENIGFDFSKESFESAGQEFIDAYADKMFGCSLHKGAKKALEFFNQNGKTQFILSALNAQALDLCVEKFGLNSFFESVRGLDDHYATSKLELGKQLIHESGVDKTKAIMIGDTTHDFETSLVMGINCILIADGHNSKQRLLECGVPVYDSLFEMLREIEN